MKIWGWALVGLFLASAPTWADTQDDSYRPVVTLISFRGPAG